MLLVIAAVEAVRSGLTSSILTSRLGQQWEWLGFRAPLASQRAERALLSGNVALAKEAATQAVIARPADPIAIRILGLAASNAGQRQRASQLMLAAAQWGWRDTPTQEWLFQNAIDAGDDRATVIYGQALVARGQLYEEVFPQFARLTTHATDWPLLTEALASGVRWRSHFYEYLINTPTELLAPMSAFLRQNERTTSRATPKEIEPFLNALIAAGRASDARALWSKVANVSNTMGISDGGFDHFPVEQEVKGAPATFDWNFDPSAEVLITVDPDDRNNKVLDIESVGNARVPIAAQRLIAPNGDWILSFRARRTSSRLGPPLEIGIACDAQGRKVVASVSVVNALATEWHQFTVPVSIDSRCAKQWLTIISRGPRASDSTGGALLDDFRATPGSLGSVQTRPVVR